MPATAPGERRFLCTPGGAIARGRLRLGRLLLGLAVLMLGLAAAAGWRGEIGPALLAAGVALVSWTAWRMSREPEILRLEIDGDELAIQLRRRRIEVPLADLTARRLSPAEIAHLEQLAARAGITAGSGGYDSRLLGEIELHASDLANAVLVEGTARLVLTPDGPEDFLRALRESRAQSDKQ